MGPAIFPSLSSMGLALEPWGFHPPVRGSLGWGQLFNFRRRLGFLYRPGPARGLSSGGIPRDCCLGVGPAGLRAALSARWRGPWPPIPREGFDQFLALSAVEPPPWGFPSWVVELASWLPPHCLGARGSGRGPGELAPSRGSERLGGPRGSILRKAWITGQIGWWRRYWRGLAPEEETEKME